MLDRKTTDLIWSYISAWIEVIKLTKSGHIVLPSCPEFPEEEILGYWNHRENCWTTLSDCDPLSIVLIKENIIPNTSLDDDENISTLAKALRKTPAWIKSFQDAIAGRQNKHTSISGYIVGSYIRNRLIKELDPEYLIID